MWLELGLDLADLSFWNVGIYFNLASGRVYKLGPINLYVG